MDHQEHGNIESDLHSYHFCTNSFQRDTSPNLNLLKMGLKCRYLAKNRKHDDEVFYKKGLFWHIRKEVPSISAL